MFKWTRSLDLYLLHQNELGQESLLIIKGFPSKLVQPFGRTFCSHPASFKDTYNLDPTILLLEIYPYMVTKKDVQKYSVQHYKAKQTWGKKSPETELKLSLNRRLVK